MSKPAATSATAEAKPEPDPEMVKAIAASLLLRGHEGSGPFGRLRYAAPRWDERTEPAAEES